MNKFLMVLGIISLMSIGHANEAVQLREGVLMDSSAQILVVMLPDGGIAALDVNTGNTRWTSADSDKPLAISNGQIVSHKQSNQVGLLKLVYQQLSNGQVSNSVDLELPAGVMTTVVDGAAHRFKIKSNSGSDSNQLSWSFSGGKVQGAAPELAELTNSEVNRSQANDTLKQGVIELDFSRHQAQLKEMVGNQTTVKARKEQKILPAVQGRQFLSQNGQHVLASTKVDSNKYIKYNWSIYALDGTLLGQMQTDYSFAQFVVKDDMLLMVEPAKGQRVAGRLVKKSPLLKAVNLQNGQAAWQHPVRSIKYFGQLPL